VNSCKSRLNVWRNHQDETIPGTISRRVWSAVSGSHRQREWDRVKLASPVKIISFREFNSIVNIVLHDAVLPYYDGIANNHISSRVILRENQDTVVTIRPNQDTVTLLLLAEAFR
jgi:hypothetical protein